MINKKAKWEQDKDKKVKDISSDIITNCLKTSQETLSIWYAENDDEIDKAIIALSANRDFINKLDYIILEDDDIKKYNLEINKSEGNSPYIEFNENHYDIVNINYSILGNVAEMILQKIKSGEKINRISEANIKAKLKKAMEKNILNKQQMSKDLLKEIL